LADLIERHDRERFEVIGVSYGLKVDCEIGTRLAAAFDQFHEMSADGPLVIAEFVADLEVDIAVDLMGYAAGARPQILANRPAPIQVGYHGYPGSVGAGFLDYLIADAVAVPEALEPFFTEKIVRLPASFLFNDTRSTPAEKLLSRAEAGLPAEGVVFCCFNEFANISKLMFELWMRLLKIVKGSVLWLTSPDGSQTAQRAADNLRRAAGARSVDPDRLIFAGAEASFPEHLARHRLADLFLDTAPCGSQWAAANALLAGLPVVTFCGETFASRVSASLLYAAGLPDLATGSLSDYESLAMRLAKDTTLLRSLKSRLADNNARITLFDAERYRRQIEAAYVTMSEIAQRGEQPRSFTVNAN